MLRLGVMLVGTLAVIMIVLSAFGSGNRDDDRTDNAEVNVTESAPPAPNQDASNDAPRLEILLPEDEPEAEIVEAESQTPEKKQKFPGPALKPSPEYAEDTDVGEVLVAAGDEAVTLYVTGNDVNVRAGPSTDDEVIGSVTFGDTVESVGPAEENWVNIRLSDGRLGYLSGSFLSATAP